MGEEKRGDGDRGERESAEDLVGLGGGVRGYGAELGGGVSERGRERVE